MKNKLFLQIIILIFFFQHFLNADEFIIESSEIKILEKGKILQAYNGVKIISKDNMEIIAKKLLYDKEKLILNVIGNVKINDEKNNFFTEGEEFIYNKKTGIIISKGKSITRIQNNYILKSDNLIYDRISSKVYSKNKSKITDLQNNTFLAERFEFNFNTNLLKAKKLSLFDSLNNQYYLNFAVVNLKENKFLGSDIFIDFEDSLFGSNENNPRLKANSIISEENETRMTKGNFTTCKQKDDKCPPWSMQAEEVVHKKKEKIIEYKKAWLKIYDKPVLYFPYFFHPDPTVKRQSGFLMPTFQNSNNSGSSLQIPYYKVISDNKDMTFYPRLFFDNEILVQSEYRQANKNSDLIFDFSVNHDSSDTRNHFFADFKSIKQNKFLDIHLETVSNDTYLKANNINSPIISNYSSLHSFINYSTLNDDSSFEISFEIFENLDKKKTDRYEYIFPNFIYEKNLSGFKEVEGELTLKTHGYNKNYDTNTDETVLINDLKYTSFYSTDSLINGFQNNYELLIKNLNSSSHNSSRYNNGEDYKLLSAIKFNSNYPLKKENEKYENYFTPKISLKYSPNATKNNTDLNKRLVYEDIFLIDRVDRSGVEGGESLTMGIEYSSKNKLTQNQINFSLASILRLNENSDLPIMNGLSEKRSDFIGKLNFVPSEFFDLNYKFSYDKDFKDSNYDSIKANLKINNFITSFEFVEEDNHMNDSSYIINKTKYKFNNNYSLNFATSKNLDKNITDYYNLIYEYENDCLTAAIEYNKSYYSDGSLKPDENILFSIKIIPFGKINSPALSK